jgi:ADP-ribose pyrophosphatase
VLLYDPQLDSVALLEQFRVGTLPGSDSPWLYELVAGLIDTDEPIETVARREAQEEASCSIRQLEKITGYYSSPGGSSEYLHLYCGLTDLSQAGGIHGLATEGEDIRVQVVGFDEAWQWLLDGRIGNAHTLIAMQWLKLNRERLRHDAQSQGSSEERSERHT